MGHLPTSIEKAAAKFGFTKVCLPGTHVVRWQIGCGFCDEVSQHGWNAETSPALMVKNMRRQSWLVEKNGPAKCPDCQTKERTMNAHVTTPVGPDPKIARRIYAALDEHFDEAKKLYKPGWDDVKIAKELEVSDVIVSKIRREAYGELAENPVLTQLKEDIGYLRIEFEDKVVVLTKDFHSKVAALEIRVHAVPGVHKKAAG